MIYLMMVMIIALFVTALTVTIGNTISWFCASASLMCEHEYTIIAGQAACDYAIAHMLRDTRIIEQLENNNGVELTFDWPPSGVPTAPKSRSKIINIKIRYKKIAYNNYGIAAYNHDKINNDKILCSVSVVFNNDKSQYIVSNNSRGHI